MNQDPEWLTNRPWPRGRAGGRRRNPGVAPLELSEPLWFQERWRLGPLGWRLPALGLVIFVVGLLRDQLAVPADRVGAVWLAVGSLGFVTFFFAVGMLPRARGLRHTRVGPEGLVIGRWEVPGSQVRQVWVLGAGEGGPVARARTADGARVCLVNFNTQREENWKRVKAVAVRWEDAPLGRPTRIPGRQRDRVLLIATKDPERLAGALSRFPNAHRATELPELERR